MKARWLRLAQPQAGPRCIRCSPHHPALWHFPVPCRWSSAHGGQLRIIEPGVEENFFPTNPLSLETRRLLGKARLNGIESLERLKFEADIGHTEDIGSRMIDRPQHRNDLDLWLLLLQFSQHQRGVQGSKAVWRAMMFRGTPVGLESRNRNASDLITSIITSAAEDAPFLKDFCLDCVHRNIFHDKIFVLVVGTLLLLKPIMAPNCTLLLKDPCFRDKDDLLEVFRIACQSDKKDAFEQFCQVHSMLPDNKIYGDIIPPLWELNRPADAFTMHQYLLSKGDFPMAFGMLKPFLRHLAASGEDVEPFLHALAAHDISFEAQIQRYRSREIPRLSASLQSSSKGAARPVRDDEPRQPSDETVARTLATFPFDFAIQSLRFFGLIEVGPVSIRQIVQSSTNSEMLKERLEKLKEFEIDTGSSAYSRLMKTLSVRGLFNMAKQLAELDMHHDEYENRDIQRRLLEQHYLHGDLQQVNNSFTILEQGYRDRGAQERSLNLLLRSAIAAEEWQKILDIVTQICQRGYGLEKHTVDFLCQGLLQEQTRQPATRVDKIAFVIGVLQQLLAADTPVGPATWRRPLVALGFHGRFEELEKLSMWLAEHYGALSPYRHDVFDGSLTKLFTPRLQLALVSWSFTKVNWRGHLSPRGRATGGKPIPDMFLVPWLRGPRLLKRLHEECKLHVSLPALQDKFVFQIRQLYYARGLNRLTANRSQAYRMYGMHPKRYLDDWNKLWGTSGSADQQKIVVERILKAHLSPKRRRSRAFWSRDLGGQHRRSRFESRLRALPSPQDSE